MPIRKLYIPPTIEGIFARTRNPMYLGMLVVVTGLALGSTNVLSLILPVVFFLHVRFVFIAKEERMLKETFGDEYRDYKTRVRRWF